VFCFLKRGFLEG